MATPGFTAEASLDVRSNQRGRFEHGSERGVVPALPKCGSGCEAYFKCGACRAGCLACFYGLCDDTPYG